MLLSAKTDLGLLSIWVGVVVLERPVLDVVTVVIIRHCLLLCLMNDSNSPCMFKLNIYSLYKYCMMIYL